MPELMLSIALPELHAAKQERLRAFYAAEEASRRARSRLYVHAAANPKVEVGETLAAEIADTSEPVFKPMAWHFSRASWIKMIAGLTYADLHQAIAMPGFYDSKWQPLKLFGLPVHFTGMPEGKDWVLV
jgi:hypothetical protein